MRIVRRQKKLKIEFRISAPEAHSPEAKYFEFRSLLWLDVVGMANLVVFIAEEFAVIGYMEF